MTSDQDSKSLPMTGIEVMKDLEIDAIKVLYLGSEKKLLPIYPKDPTWLKIWMTSLSEPPEVNLSRCMYLKSDVENFKLSCKELWYDLQKQKRDATAPSAAKYIKLQRLEGVSDDIIAFELHNPKGSFKLTHKKVAIALGLDKELNADQHDAIKKQGQRACDKGKALLHKK
jgi:hypothetical protein